MNFKSGRHCKIIRSIGVPLGLWPYRRTTLGKLNGALAVTIILLGILSQLAVFITHEFSVDLLLKCVTGIVLPTFSIMQYLVFMWKMDQVKYFFEWIQSDYDSLAHEWELRVLDKSADRGTNISKIFVYLFSFLLILFGFPLVPVLFNVGTSRIQSRKVLIPINVEYFVDQDRYFYWIMFHIDATTVLWVSILFAIGVTFVQFAIHACGLLEVVGGRVERILESSNLNARRGKTYLSIHDQLVATIQLHQRTLKFIETLNTTLLQHYCIIMSAGVISLSMNLYILARAMLLMTVTAEMLIAVILIVIHYVYMGCGLYICQILLDKGNDLFMKTYYARWHEAPLPVQKMLLYIRQRTMQPTGIVFGGLYTGSLEFYSKLVNSSMSYFTVLYSTA